MAWRLLAWGVWKRLGAQDYPGLSGMYADPAASRFITVSASTAFVLSWSMRAACL